MRRVFLNPLFWVIFLSPLLNFEPKTLWMVVLVLFGIIFLSCLFSVSIPVAWVEEEDEK